MKYLLKIVVINVLFLFIALWYFIIGVWEFKFYKLINFIDDYKEAVKYNWKKAFKGEKIIDYF